MEEARQHPALTTFDRVTIAGRVGFFLCAIAILVSAFLRSSNVVPLAAAGCFFAVLNLIGFLWRSIATGTVRWKKTLQLRSEKPRIFWSVISFTLVTLVAYLAVAIFLMGLL
jgi:hypothetical protein